MADVQKTANRNQRVEQTRGGQTYIPAVDILEKDDELLLIADVPGVQPEGVDIDFERGELRVRARVAPRQQPNVKYGLREYGVGDFVRTFEIGDDIDAQRISADLRDGVLYVHLPKAESARTRRIQVKAG